MVQAGRIGARVRKWSPWPMLRSSAWVRMMQQPIRAIAKISYQSSDNQLAPDHLLEVADHLLAAVEPRQLRIGVNAVDFQHLSTGRQPPREIRLGRTQARLLPVQHADDLPGVIEDGVGQPGVVPAHRHLAGSGRADGDAANRTLRS